MLEMNSINNPPTSIEGGSLTPDHKKAKSEGVDDPESQPISKSKIASTVEQRKPKGATQVQPRRTFDDYEEYVDPPSPTHEAPPTNSTLHTAEMEDEEY